MCCTFKGRRKVTQWVVCVSTVKAASSILLALSSVLILSYSRMLGIQLNNLPLVVCGCVCDCVCDCVFVCACTHSVLRWLEAQKLNIDIVFS